jgi:hypothetical protein
MLYKCNVNSCDVGKNEKGFLVYIDISYFPIINLFSVHIAWKSKHSLIFPKDDQKKNSKKKYFSTSFVVLTMEIRKVYIWTKICFCIERVDVTIWQHKNYYITTNCSRQGISRHMEKKFNDSDLLLGILLMDLPSSQWKVLFLLT